MRRIDTVFLLITITLLVRNKLTCDGILIANTGSGGLLRGDPAPGRSPGPPSDDKLGSRSSPFHRDVTDEEEERCSWEEDGVHRLATSSDDKTNVTVEVSHRLFNTDVLVFGLVYQVTIRQLRVQKPVTDGEYIISSTMRGLPRGNFHPTATGRSSSCPEHVHKGQFLEYASVVLNWTVEGTRQFNRSNITFTLKYKTDSRPVIYEAVYEIPVIQDCQVWLKNESGEEIGSWHFPRRRDCLCWFPGPSSDHGLVVDVTRLNVPCARGDYLYFSGLNISSSSSPYQQRQHIRAHRQTHICGKLEELPPSDRRVYFPPSHTPPFLHLHGDPVFAFNYRLVDYCYNVTFTSRNGSFDLVPSKADLRCTFKIYLPYGHRIALTLIVSGVPERIDSDQNNEEGLEVEEEEQEGGSEVEEEEQEEEEVISGECSGGLRFELQDGGDGRVRSHCTRFGDAERRVEFVSRENKLVIKVWSVPKDLGGGASPALPSLRMRYRAEPIEELTKTCDFGWVAYRQFCLIAMEEMRLPWMQAEMECGRRGGHLASVRDGDAQEVIDRMLLNSPGYRDYNAYWIGASDRMHEGDFHWSDGLPFAYANWFPGWPEHGYYNRQPNDDGLSNQDCVEVRRTYSRPTSSPNLAPGFMWNDRHCSTPNYFICERLLRTDEPPEESWPPDCNKSVTLSSQQQRAIVSSPGFPRQYPDNADCNTDITAPAGFRIVLDFEELVLENEPSCSYDYLEIWEGVWNSSHPNDSQSGKRLCGDWSSKLKLLRYVSKGSKLKLRFFSDYSHHYGGFKVRVSTENAIQCADDRFKVFNNSCYLFVSYPEVMWNTSEEICTNIGCQLASILTADEDHFITSNIREASEYRTTASYWLGARTDKSGRFSWTDGNEMLFTNWVPGERLFENDIIDGGEPVCLSTLWVPSTNPLIQSGFYWRPRRCSAVGGFVCKRRRLSFEPGINFNKTVNGSEGQLTTPNYPGNYYNNLEFTIKIVGTEGSRVIVHFDKIDVESQLKCLYDYIELKSVEDDAVRHCGYFDTNMNRFDFVSRTNMVELRFHSDYSIARGGFYLRWYSVEVSGCPELTLTAKEGIIRSPNYPHFLLANLDCTFTVLAPPGKRVFLEFTDFNLSLSNNRNDMQKEEFEMLEEAVVTIKLGYNSPLIYPYRNPSILTEGAFLSYAEKLILRLRTKNQPTGRGFKAIYRTLGQIDEERILTIENATSGALLHLNFPDEPPRNSSLVHHIIAPVGHVISIELYDVKLNATGCSKDDSIEIKDNYADANGTRWLLCNAARQGERSNKIFVMSYLNTLHVRQNGGSSGVSLNATLKVHLDRNYFVKLLTRRNDAVESCHPNPCRRGGRCVSVGNRKTCQCQKYFTGLFCALTQCDLEPCKFGSCELTETSFKCHCKNGYTGATCEQRRKPCQGNPCENRGVCTEKGDSFQCQCHAWWKGTRCEERMMHIPYKPLSERMLHEPFWLGLMTVTIVMAVIGLVWCAKRHFPEKIEKLLAEDEDRSRSTSTIPSLRSSSVREQLAASAAAAAASAGAVSAAPNPGPGVPRSLFGRLGIRKPSILSLTSPHASGYAPATARTFSLDDLLKPPPRRTPSPKKKRNNSTPTKKNAAEKKQILQQLVSPAANKQNSRKVSLGELIQMSESNLKDGNNQKRSEDSVKETKLTIDRKAIGNISSGQLSLIDPKLEKKVTFARLLSKVSQEMSSGSDIELGIMHANKLSCAFARPCSSSTPPSPGANVRSPNSTSSNQGSDSLTSSDLAIPSALSSSVSDLICNRPGRPARLPIRQKPASADSILAMFRNFSSSSAGANLPASLRVSPSTTPTASSPQDDAAGDDDSTSTSSVHTPVSFSSGGGPPESPPVPHRRFSQSTIEVPVLDPLNAAAHKSSSGGSNFLHPPTILLEIPSTISKCLSPIREMPTPLPSPALTPVMRRSHHLPSAAAAAAAATEIVDDPDNSDDRISVELPNISISDEDDMHSVQDIAIDPLAEDGLIQKEVVALQLGSPSAMFKIKSRPSPLGQTSETTLQIPNIEISSESSTSPLPVSRLPTAIPTLTIQAPSPTHKKPPFCGFAGSPPPKSQEDTFQFAAPKTSSSSSRKMLKEFDKPTSLDLPCAPPLITITCNLSEAESDAESISPGAVKTSGHMGVSSAVGMTYLSPFSMVTRGDHNASESNLSSSGYSSMASPGPSRCGSSNPLCPPEMEDPGPPGAGPTNLSHPSTLRRHAPTLLKTESSDEAGDSRRANAPDNRKEQRDRSGRGRSDSETLSDDPPLESNDEGIGTDHIDEKIEDGEVKSAKELEVFINDASKKVKLDLPLIAPPTANCSFEETLAKRTLQLPSIVVQYDTLSLDKCVASPVSSRSESPLSDRTSGVGRFSPQFYGRHKDPLPFTDSDGLYDFPSSDKVNVSCTTQQHRKSIGRKREKKASRTSKTPSPTKGPTFSCTYHLELPKKEPTSKPHMPSRKASPKRRTRTQKLMSSSSSSESVNSAKEMRLSSSSPSPETIRWVSSVDCFSEKTKSPEASGEETADDANSVMLPRSDQDLYRHKKISRLRTISHQIRFLRRLEQSLKKKERTVSPTDSFNSDEDSPRATSPLLQVKEPKIEIRKSNSSGRLQSNTSYVPSARGRNTKFRKSELLIPEHDRAWKKAVITGNGHSD